MTTDCPTFTLTLPSDPRSLSVARNFVETVSKSFNLDRRTVHAIVLAAGEAVTNIIRHAHRDRPSAQMTIRFQMTPGAARVTFQDEGEPFDIAAVPHMEPGELRIGGRGVFMMRSLMDELSCQPQGNRGNLLSMVKRCRAAVAV